MTLGSVALQGEMGSVAAVGHRFSNLADLNGAMGQLRAGIGQVRDSGNSNALTALATACTPIETLAQQIATARHNVGVVLVSYASEVTALQDEVRRLRLQLEDARAQAAFTKRSLTEQQPVSLVESVSADALMRTRMLEFRAEEEAADLRRIERALDACDDARRAADAACVHKISGYSDAFASATMHAGTGVPKVTLASLFTVAASSTQAAARDAALTSLLSGNPSPDEVEARWNKFSSELQQQLIQEASLTIGNLDGIPIPVRILANRVTAASYAKLPDIPEQERKYWTAVADGKRNLIINDRDNYRIAELLGNIDERTKRVVTYIPGTSTRMGSFYGGGVQQVGQFLSGDSSDGHTAVIVYKDGLWPSWLGKTTNWDAADMEKMGDRVFTFQQNVLDRDPYLKNLPEAAIAHSAGMTILSAAEVAGARYNQVYSLSGSFLAPGWKPEASTQYNHYQYQNDLLEQLTLRIGENAPVGRTEVFESHVYENPQDFSWTGHNRIAQGPKTNDEPLKEILKTLEEGLR